MMKKAGIVGAAMAVGAFLTGGVAAAATPDGHGGHDADSQFGALNLNDTDALHNVNATLGVCELDLNVLIVQVPIHDTLNGLGVPILSPGEHEAAGESPQNCASGSVADGGTSQGH